MNFGVLIAVVSFDMKFYLFCFLTVIKSVDLSPAHFMTQSGDRIAVGLFMHCMYFCFCFKTSYMYSNICSARAAADTIMFIDRSSF